MAIAVAYSLGVILGASLASIPKIIKIGPKTKELWSFLSPPLLPLIFTEIVEKGKTPHCPKVSFHPPVVQRNDATPLYFTSTVSPSNGCHMPKKKNKKKISFEKIIEGLKGWDKGGTIKFCGKREKPPFVRKSS